MFVAAAASQKDARCAWLTAPEPAAALLRQLADEAAWMFWTLAADFNTRITTQKASTPSVSQIWAAFPRTL